MKLSKLINQKIKTILTISLTAAVVGIVIYALVWGMYNKEQSKRFIVSHLKEIIVAQVTSQNTFNLDGELNRIVDTWSRTQEFPVRVNLYLDQRHWAHAGPLTSFGMLSSKDSYSEILPNGQMMNLEIETDLKSPLFRLLIVISVFTVFFVFVYLSLKKSLSRAANEIAKPLENRVEKLIQAESNLSDFAKIGFQSKDSQIDELKRLDSSLAQLFLRINQLECEVAQKKFSEGQLEMAKQVSHALNGSLSALSIYLNNSSDNRAIDKEALKKIVDQISSVSKNLISSKLATESNQKKEFDLAHVINKVVEQKRNELKVNGKTSIKIDFINNAGSKIVVQGSESQMTLALINLMTNSIEAISDKGQIDLSLNKNEENILFEVKDSGKGIPKNVIPNLMKEGATFGKMNGSGLGLFHVSKIVETFKGQVEIYSEEGIGTNVTITIPYSTTKSLNKFNQDRLIKLFHGQELVIVDDDDLIHKTWDHIIQRDIDKLKAVHLYSDMELEHWLLMNQNDVFSSRLFLMDYDLKSKSNGLDLIERHGLAFESFLVTGMHDDQTVKSRARNLKVKIIPKDTLSEVEFDFENQITSAFVH